MSKLTIKYMDNSIIKKNVTGADTSVTNHFLEIKTVDKRTEYIPLCNIKEIEIEGANKIRGE